MTAILLLNLYLITLCLHKNVCTYGQIDIAN